MDACGFAVVRQMRTKCPPQRLTDKKAVVPLNIHTHTHCDADQKLHARAQATPLMHTQMPKNEDCAIVRPKGDQPSSSSLV